MRSDADIQETMHTYADMVYRLGLVYMHNTYDAQDVFQKVFMKYALCNSMFDSEEHKKAWLIRVTSNCCKSELRTHWKKNVDLTQEDTEIPVAEDYRDLWTAINELDPKYRTAIYLHYFEGYKANEIARILRRRENTIYSWLARGREHLKGALEERDDK